MPKTKDLKVAVMPEPVAQDECVESVIEGLVAEGVSRSLAEIFAYRQAPGSRFTDKAFLQDRANGSQFKHLPAMGDYYKSVAEKQGFSTHGKVYVGGIARYPGDPQAWVSGVDDVKRVCRERNLHCEGAVKHVAYDVPPPDPVPLADDLVSKHMKGRMEPGRKYTRKELATMKESVLDAHAPHWKKPGSKKKLPTMKDRG